MKIEQLKQGLSARITGFAQGRSVYRQRLLALGLVPNTVIQLMHIAPLGDPITIHVRGASLSLRKQEAAILLLEPVC